MTTMRMAHTMIRVRDLDATLAFYTDFIGLRELRRKQIGEEATLVWLGDGAGTYTLELTFNHDPQEYVRGNQFGHLAFTVDDLDAVIAEVTRRGWPCRRSRPELDSRYIFIQDPDGYDIEILQA
ncbi:MAG: VOC family protein [Acidobacteriota bacterium]